MLELWVEFVSISFCAFFWFGAVMMLQLVMVSPGTHLVKNHESLSITNESQFKKTRSPRLKMLEPLWRQTPRLFIAVYCN